jgi:hypothetical protein
MVSGRLIKALGGRTLEAAENFSIRRRLAAIRSMVQNKPPTFWIDRSSDRELGSHNDAREVLNVIDDLRELLR